MTDKEKQELARKREEAAYKYELYQKSGNAMLAYKLQKLFIKIENQDDSALHNDILADVLQIVQGNYSELLNGFSELILRIGRLEHDKYMENKNKGK